MNVLDIGCSLGDFTKRVAQLDQKNKIYGTDISNNAIEYVSKKYPNIVFEVAGLPHIPFENKFFDLVLCLEVLNYLDKNNRVLSIENIKNILKPGGYLFFSGVLDDGQRYFKEKEILDLISLYFEVTKVDYNYSRIYTSIERNLLILMEMTHLIETISTLSRGNSHKFFDEIEGKNKARILKNISHVINTVPLGWSFTFLLNQFAKITAKKVLSTQLLVYFVYYITKIVYGEKGKTQIIILARTRS